VSNYFTYITTNPARTVLYVGMTNDVEQRIIEHFLNRGDKKTFAGRYYCYNLIYYERFDRPDYAIDREKELKAMSRKQKEELIATINLHWDFWNSKIMDWPPQADVKSR
jgi:putative endonuclease